ncbi:hypothetical protein BHU72_07135 [Desulfuribacillus stibiiarsenatis]|uniref:Doubled CXXCH motif domain-containing protein n=1 Tax=Desulfuribacillus stibiiarsenatis TaxID=1390249 RepID=A0A1E5L499_9FIRM|nr:hypothetical protein [Desulfuribacillus stibiiarsenatis]OEH84958.1 hypothetical protein BHU72_07135 [Desulfuribacillus stibiiarsenatis]
MSKKVLFLAMLLVVSFTVLGACELEPMAETPAVSQPTIPNNVGVDFVNNTFHKKHTITQCTTCHLDMTDEQFVKTKDGQLASTMPVTGLKNVEREVCLSCHTAGDLGFYKTK